MSAVIKCRNQILKEALSIHLIFITENSHLYLLPECHRRFVELTTTLLTQCWTSLSKVGVFRLCCTKKPQTKPRSDSCCRFCSFRSLSRTHFHVAMENFCFCPAHQAAQCVCHTHARAKIIGVWKIQSCWIFPTFWHFNLKGHSWLSSRICDAAGEANYSDRKTMQKRTTAQNRTSRSFLSSFAALITFTLALWCVISIEPLKGRTQDPSLLN